VLAFAFAGAAAPAEAQTLETPAVEIGAGLQFLHIPGETYPFGWNVDLSGPVGDRQVVRWVGEGGYARDNPLPVETLSFYHFGAGIRLMPVNRHRAAPFFQLLGGAAYSKNQATEVGLWGPMVQPGVGVSVPIARYVNIVGQADYRMAIFSGQVDNEFRFSAGARFMLW
jgi:hypothetical protein